MEKIHLPDRKTFTRKQLVERWECDLSLIEDYIKAGQLREAFNTTKRASTPLRQMKYYIYNDNNERLLDFTTYGKPLSEIVGEIKQKNITDSCPLYLYSPIILEEYQGDIYDRFRNLIDDNYDGDEEYHEEKLQLINDCIPYPFFHSFTGDILIPIKEKESYMHNTLFVPKECDLIIPLEEVRRIESNISQTDEKKPSITSRSDKKTTKKDIDNHSSQKDDDASVKPLPPTDDKLLTIKQVAEIVELSESHIYSMISEGRFPKQSHPGGGRASRWSKLEVMEWFEKAKHQRK